MVERDGAIQRRTRIEFPEGVRPPQSELLIAQVGASAAVPGKGPGMLRTFNTPWHNEVPERNQIMSQDMPLQQNLAHLQNHAFLKKGKKGIASISCMRAVMCTNMVCAAAAAASR